LLHAGKFFQDCSEVLSVVTGEGSGYVLPNSESWIHSIGCFPHFFYDPNGFHEKARPFSCKTCSASSNGQILAGASKGYAIHRFYFIAVDFCYVTQVNHIDLISFLVRTTSIELAHLLMGDSQKQDHSLCVRISDPPGKRAPDGATTAMVYRFYSWAD
jgi:hypothetical protein